jgi:quercetin dioxygenase-like cupin family protein
VRYPSLRLIKNGPDVPPEAFTRDVRSRRYTFTGVCDVERVLEAYQQGATILLQRLDRTWPALGALCRALEERVRHPADANVYLTPKAAQGFGAHYDAHDVFILQISGTKHWRLYGAPFPLPLESQPFDRRTIDPGPCLQELDVHPGDLIYLPRGTIHEALTSESSSLHVTVGITPQTWTDALVAAVLARAGADPRLREALPLSESDASARGAERQRRFAALLASVSEHVDVGAVLASLQARFVAERRPHLQGRLIEIEEGTAVGFSTLVTRRPGLVYRIAVADGHVTLSFHGKSITYPAGLEAALRAVAESEPMEVAAIPGDTDPLERLLLAQRLVREGFLVVQS